MKILKNLILVLPLIMGGTVCAQRSTFFDGTYKLDYGNQTIRIENNGGQYYKAYFTGDCNAHTLKGKAENNSVLMFPLAGGNSGDFIMVSKQGNKLNVSVRGKDIMRSSCNGASIEGLYSKKYNYSQNSYNSYNDKYYNNEHDNYYSDNYGQSYKIRSLESGLVLDANMHHSDAVSVWKQHGGANQTWIITKLGNGEVSIKNKGNGRALTSSNSSRNGEFVSLKPWTNSNTQKWNLERLSGNEYYIVSKVNGKVLDVSTGEHNMTTYERNGSAHQKWILEKTY